jgi:hypothetical protein
MTSEIELNDAQISKIGEKIISALSLLELNHYLVEVNRMDIFKMICPDHHTAKLNDSDFFNLVILALGMHTKIGYPVYSELEIKDPLAGHQN